MHESLSPSLEGGTTEQRRGLGQASLAFKANMPTEAVHPEGRLRQGSQEPTMYPCSIRKTHVNPPNSGRWAHITHSRMAGALLAPVPNTTIILG